MITSYEFHEWIFSSHNILKFSSVIKLHHSPYYIIMDLTSLSKNIMISFDMENSAMPSKQKKMILKYFVEHSLRYLMK
jgi:hypothetical protein